MPEWAPVTICYCTKMPKGPHIHIPETDDHGLPIRTVWEKNVVTMDVVSAYPEDWSYDPLQKWHLSAGYGKGREMASNKIVATFIHERETSFSSVYSELAPGQIVHTLRVNTVSLRQTYGDVPERIQITIMALDPDMQIGEPTPGRHGKV